MVWQQTPVAYVLVVAGIGSFLQAAYVAVRVVSGRSRRLTYPFLGVALSGGLWAVAYGFQIANSDPTAKFLIGVFASIGIVGLSAAWPAFVLAYTGRTRWLRPRRLAALAAFPAFVIGLAYAGDPGNLVVADSGMGTFDGIEVFVLTPGPLMVAFVVYSTLVNLVTFALLAQAAVESRGVLRRQALVLLVAGTLPTVANIVGTTGVLPGLLGAITLTPLAFAVTVPLVAWALSQHGLLELVPLAKQSVLDHLDEGVVVLDHEGRVLDTNRTARDLFGEDVVGTRATDLFADSPALLRVVDGDQESARLPTSIDGTERVFEASVVDIRSAMAAEGGRALVLHDVTERQQYEQRLQVLNRALRHDLRNDVGVILGGARLLEDWHEDHGTDPEAERALSMIRAKVDELVDMSEKARLVDYSLHRDGDTTARIDVAALVRSTTEAARSAWPDADVTVETPDRAFARADTLVGSAIDNVVENALEHNDDPSPELHVVVEERGDHVVVTVSDDGPGIPSADRRVLETGVETPLEHANGLGLWLVNWIVTRADGDLSIADREPRGTTVTLRFPAAEPPEHGRQVGEAVTADD